MTSDFINQAWKYALGEMAPAEAAAFEERLSVDQSAREALGEAVLLMSAVRQSSGSLAPGAGIVRSEPVRRRSALAVVASCAAACLLVVSLLRFGSVSSRFEAHELADGRAIVGAWTALTVDDSGPVEADGVSLADDASDDVPDWLVAAVLDESESTSAEGGTL